MKRLFQLCVLFLVFTCSDDDNNIQNENLNLNLVSGLDIRPDDVSPSIRLGNPNVLYSETIVYPNPAPSVLSINTNNGAQISDVWIVNGEVNQNLENVDFTSILTSDIYSEEELLNNSVQSLTNQASNNININLEDFEEGYYRVFIKINETIEWHNIYVGVPDIDEFINSWN